MKRILILALALMCLTFGFLTMEAQAEEAATSGTCGENLTWVYDEETKTLTISGTGNMYDFSYYEDMYAPWYEILHIEHVEIEEGVTSIGDYAFSSLGSMVSITIPEGITRIGDYAFKNCARLTEVSFPSTLTDMEGSAFHNCDSLEIVDINNLVAWCEMDLLNFGNPLNDAKEIRVNGEAITELIIPDGVERIGKYAFYDCDQFTALVIPDTVTEIGEGAFQFSTFETIELPTSVTIVGESAFGSVRVSKLIYLHGSMEQWNLINVSGDNDILLNMGPEFHRWGEGERTDPTCAQNGWVEYTCQYCTETYREEIAATKEHTEVVDVAVEATCTETGLTEGKHCSVCEEILIEQESVSTLGHTEAVDAAVAATCKETGLTEGSHCSVCNAVLVEQEIIPKSDYHTYDDGTILEDSTDTTYGTIQYTCTICGDNYLDSLPLYDYYGYVGDVVSLTLSSSSDYAITGAEVDGKNVSVVFTGTGYSFTSAGYKCNFYFDLSFHEAGTFTIEFTQLLANPYVYTARIVEREEAEPTEPAPTEPEETKPTEPAPTEPEETEPTEPAPTEPEETEPTEPAPTESEETEPTEPAPTEPEETEPTEPAPTEPEETEPTEPAPTEPEETEPTEPPCEHAWSKWNITAPTAKKEGKRTRECELCGEVEKETLPKLSGEFQDVKDTEYYALPVDWAVQNNITNGVAEGKFGPDQDCTRGQIVTFLWRAAGSPEPTSTRNPFKDVKKDDYFYKAVLWAVEEGITNGLSEKSFGPNQVCTRAQVCTFLWRAQGKPGAESKNPFKDVKKGEYYYDAVLWAVENGVTNGMSEGKFAPDSTCTRGQIVTFLYRAIA